MRVFLTTACLALGVSMAALPASAGSRYGTPPPIELSPDLASPWTLQLKQRAKRARIQRQNRTRPARKRRASLAGTVRSQPKLRSSTTVQKQQKPARKQGFDPELLPQIVDYPTSKKPGTIVIDTTERRLYLVMSDGKARRYGVGVGKPGFQWAGTHKVTRKAEWPSWRPPAEMIKREAAKGRTLPAFVPGGPDNPLGARSLYLGSTLYRIHGTTQPWSIGRAVSSGCIRMRNEDVMDLYDRVKVGTRVHVI